MALPSLWRRKKSDCSILISDSISDILWNKVDLGPVLVDISAATTHDEWVNIDERIKDVPQLYPPPPPPHPSTGVVCGGVGQKGRKVMPSGSLGSVANLSIFRLSPVKFRERYQSHFEALGRHLFVSDAERCSVDCANFSNPTYSRSSHKLTNTHTRH